MKINYKNLFNILFLISAMYLINITSVFGNNDVIENLEFEKTLKISRPSSTISVDTDTYFITGTCDPDKPLSVNDKIVNDTESGIFGVEVNLNSEKNIFNFKQEDKEESVTIFKDTPISSIKQNKQSKPDLKKSPPFPATNKIVTDQTLTLSCLAPSSSVVTATVDDLSFDLTPADSDDEYTTFSTEATFEDEKYQSEYYNAGPVKYTITNSNTQEEIISDGYVIFSDSEDLSTQFVEVNKTHASIFEKPNVESATLTTIKRGCVLETDTDEENENWFKLKDFGWIMKSSVCPADPNSDINNVISDISFSADKTEEKFILSGTCKPNFAAAYSPSGLTIRLYHTTDANVTNEMCQNSNIIESISSDSQPLHTDIKISLKSDVSLSGYNIEYEENNTIITLIKNKKISNNSLKNISVIIDPGHGGFDTGAEGLLGKIGGPYEKDFNLTYALALKDKLKELGANVVLTRNNDYNCSLNNIANKTENEKPDFFISIHSDSIDDNISPDKVSGYTIFYSQKDFSKNLSELINKNLSKKDLIKSRGSKNSDYYVTKNTFCPSVLIELGMITNSKDVSLLISNNYLNHFVNSVSSAILNNEIDEVKEDDDETSSENNKNNKNNKDKNKDEDEDENVIF